MFLWKFYNVSSGLLETRLGVGASKEFCCNWIFGSVPMLSVRCLDHLIWLLELGFFTLELFPLLKILGFEQLCSKSNDKSIPLIFCLIFGRLGQYLLMGGSLVTLDPRFCWQLRIWSAACYNFIIFIIFPCNKSAEPLSSNAKLLNLLHNIKLIKYFTYTLSVILFSSQPDRSPTCYHYEYLRAFLLPQSRYHRLITLLI